MRERALVMEVANRRITVMLSGGRFQRVGLNQPVTVGQEIWMESRSVQNFYPAVAAAVLCLVVIGALGPRLVAPAPPAAAFSLDFAPSIDIGVSARGRVVSAKSFNSAGARLLNQASVMGRSATAAALTLTRIGVSDHMVSTSDPYVLVGGAVGQGSGAWFRALTKGEVRLVHDHKWNINVVVAETHAAPVQYASLDTSIGRSLLDARTFASTVQVAQPSDLTSILSRSGVLEASGATSP